MVSYFLPRGRFLIKSANLRQVQSKNEKKRQTFYQFRQTFSTNNGATDTKLIKNTVPNIKSTNESVLKPQKCQNPQNLQPSNKAWLRWTKLFLKLAPVSFFAFGVMEWQYHKQKYTHTEEPRRASHFQMKMYCSLPLRIISRCWGWLAGCYIPNFLRPFVYGTYSQLFNVKLNEALYSDPKHYNSLAEFFTRSLHPDARPIDPTALLISPADGRVLHFGVISANSLVEQVKGVNYNLQDFLGPATWKQEFPGREQDYAKFIKERKHGDSNLYQCVIYLAPGDYHRFHSPAAWSPKIRRHFAGELLSVNPRVAHWLPELFCINERALYIGAWEQGFFSYTAVGATNVGSVEIYFDKDLKTNCWMGLKVGALKARGIYDELILEQSKSLQKGEILGQFNMGSTIVLIFEAPKNFVFTIENGQNVVVGQSLGHLS